MTALKNEVSCETEGSIHNYSDDELIFKELFSKCHLLETQKVELLRTKQNLLVLNEKYENVSRRLLKMKSDFDDYKSHLHKTLYNLRVTADKQKIMSRMRLDDFLKRRKQYEEYYKVSPIKCMLEELVNENRKLEKEYETKVDELKLRQKQNHELFSYLKQTFQRKVCEFSEAVLTFKGNQ